MHQEVVYGLLRNADKQTYSSLKGVSKGFKQTARGAQPLLSWRADIDSKTAFYEGYQLTAYQNAMLKHLVNNGANSMYTVIPDWENLFLITLLYGYEMSKTQKVVIFSAWPQETILSILGEVDDFYDLYARKIQHAVRIVPVEYGTYIKTETIETGFALGLNTAQKLYLDWEKKKEQHVDVRLRLLTGTEDYYHIHPSYVEEQTQDVWVTNSSPGYDLKEERMYVRDAIPRSVLKRHTIFSVDAAFVNAYALYCLLARSGDGNKMLINYWSYPTDYGPNGVNPGCYFLPLKFFLQLPEWMRLKSSTSDILSVGLNYLEILLLEFRLDLAKKKRIWLKTGLKNTAVALNWK